jgi:hypothetical protein
VGNVQPQPLVEELHNNRYYETAEKQPQHQKELFSVTNIF